MTLAEVAQVSYVEAQTRLDNEARKEAAEGEALRARITRNYARIAWFAARAEVDDPEPESRPCSVCAGIRVCDWAAHLARMT